MQPAEYSPDVVKALDTLIDDPTLDYLDTTCGCNTIEYLLKELNKHNLINSQHVQQFASQRDPVMVSLSKMDLNHQPSSIIQHLKKAEAPLNGILKALDNEYNKMQEPGMLGMLCELLSGNNFELILSVATMEGQLKTFVSRMIRWNEKSRQVGGEVNNTAVNRSALFDVTFLTVTPHARRFVQSKHRFGHISMQDKYAEHRCCEQSKVDEFLTSISSNDGSMAKIPNLKWHEICLILPGVLYQLLVAWENDTISAADVIVHLDNIKSRLCTYSVCAASWLCSYMQIVRDDELLKPLNM
ncbi:mediator of RNA polymerase II transcription subunit 24-like, partial [Sitodiplosis mosellana]|uniref:mediator of RNA polymerase II transcription subunit 24-like n=1 Tax=Sitodiplosis mosellana TaxID=263140 RepID=UPI00244416BF